MASEWYYSHDGARHGPISSDQLRDLAATGRLRPDDLVWKEGMETWLPAAKVKGLLAVPARAPARAADAEGGPSPGMPRDIAHKKLAAGLTAIQAGAFGIHKFVLGQTTAGLIALLITVLTCGAGSVVMVVIGMVEGVIYLRMSDEEFYQTYIVEKKAWF